MRVRGQGGQAVEADVDFLEERGAQVRGQGREAGDVVVGEVKFL